MPGIAVVRRWLVSAALVLMLWSLVAVGGSLPALATADPQQSGAELFELHCVGCHVHGGNVIRRGKTLKLQALQRQGLDSPEAIAQIAAGGIGQMSGYGQVLGADGAEVLGRWIWQQAQLDWR